MKDLFSEILLDGPTPVRTQLRLQQTLWAVPVLPMDIHPTVSKLHRNGSYESEICPQVVPIETAAKLIETNFQIGKNLSSG